MSDVPRCKVCKRPVTTGAHFRIETVEGAAKRETSRDGTRIALWGVMHPKCMARVLQRGQSVLEALEADIAK